MKSLKQQTANSNDLIDVDQVYLKNDDMNELTPKQELSPIHTYTSGIILPINVSNKPPIKTTISNDDDDEDDTQYLSQPASSVCNETLNDNSSCQIYLTPAGSWQTLTNLNLNFMNNNNNNNFLNSNNNNNNNEIRVDVNDDNNSITPQQLTPIAGITPIIRSYIVDTDDNKTDLDEQEFEEERNTTNYNNKNSSIKSYEEDEGEEEEDDEETQTTIQNSGRVTVDKDDLIYTKTTTIVRMLWFYSRFFLI